VRGRAPNGAAHVPVGEPEPPQVVVWHQFLDQRKELPLLKPDVCGKQFPRRLQRLSIDDAGRHGDAEFASEPLEPHVLEACLAEGSRLRLDVPEKKREQLFFLVPKVDTLFVPEERPEFPGRREPSRGIAVRGSTAQPHRLHESIVMVARERDQGGVAPHSTTLGYGVVPAVLGGAHPSSVRLSPRHRFEVLSDLLGAVARPRERHRLLEAGFAEDVPAGLGARLAGRPRPRSFALVPVAAGQIETTVEVALLGHDLRVPQDEAVRVEEAA